MNMVGVIFGGAGFIIFLLIVVLNYKVLLNIQNYGAAAYSMFFLRDQVRAAFKHLVIAACIFAVLSFVAVIGTIQGSSLSYLIEVGGMIIFLAYLRFFYTVAKNTDIEKMQEEEILDDDDQD